MGLYLMRDGDEEDLSFFASWGGMRVLTEFIDANKGKYPTLHEFSEQGYTYDLEHFVTECERAKSETDKDTQEVLQNIIEITKEAEVQVLIT